MALTKPTQTTLSVVALIHLRWTHKTNVRSRHLQVSSSLFLSVVFTKPRAITSPSVVELVSQQGVYQAHALSRLTLVSSSRYLSGALTKPTIAHVTLLSSSLFVCPRGAYQAQALSSFVDPLLQCGTYKAYTRLLHSRVGYPWRSNGLC